MEISLVEVYATYVLRIFLKGLRVQAPSSFTVTHDRVSVRGRGTRVISSYAAARRWRRSLVREIGEMYRWQNWAREQHRIVSPVTRDIS